MDIEELNTVPESEFSVGNFAKEAKNAKDLIDLLIERNMKITESQKEEAVEFLSLVNYYKISGYWFKFQNKWLKKEDGNADKFVVPVTFQNIIDIYRFDTKLRSLCLDALEKIEICVMSQICNHMCINYGAFGYGDSQYIKSIYKTNKSKDKRLVIDYASFRAEIAKIIVDNRFTDSTLKNFYNKYNNKFPPFWMIAQFLTFGSIARLYSALPVKDQREIAAKLKLNSRYLESVLQALSYIRNICAHYKRLWDRSLGIVVPNIKLETTLRETYRYNYKFHKIPNVNDNHFFPAFYTISFLLSIITPYSKYSSLVKKLIDKYNSRTNLINYEKMGFPDEWEDLPLFEKMLENE